MRLVGLPQHVGLGWVWGATIRSIIGTLYSICILRRATILRFFPKMTSSLGDKAAVKAPDYDGKLKSSHYVSLQRRSSYSRANELSAVSFHLGPATACLSSSRCRLLEEKRMISHLVFQH